MKAGEKEGKGTAMERERNGEHTLEEIGKMKGNTGWTKKYKAKLRGGGRVEGRKEESKHGREYGGERKVYKRRPGLEKKD